MKPEVQDKLIEALERNRGTPTISDKESVLISEMKYNALRMLADPKNIIFSQVSLPETHLFAQAVLFASDPYPSITVRLVRKLKEMKSKQEQKGIEEGAIPITDELISELIKPLPILEGYIQKIKIERHSVDRKRVAEHTELAKALAPRMGDTGAMTQSSTGILGRIRNSLV